MCVIMYMGWKLEGDVSRWYRKEYFWKSYEWCTLPINGLKIWPKTGLGVIEPLKIEKMPGRPKK